MTNHRTYLLGVSLMATLAHSPHCVAQSPGERDTGFRIVLERRTEKPPGFQANITTTSSYPCEGYSLRTQVRWDKDTVSVYVLGLVRPSPCVHSSAEATGSAFVGEIRENISFFRITYRGDVDLHRVVRSRGRMSVHPLKRTFTEVRVQ